MGKYQRDTAKANTARFHAGKTHASDLRPPVSRDVEYLRGYRAGLSATQDSARLPYVGSGGVTLATQHIDGALVSLIADDEGCCKVQVLDRRGRPANRPSALAYLEVVENFDHPTNIYLTGYFSSDSEWAREWLFANGKRALKFYRDNKVWE